MRPMRTVAPPMMSNVATRTFRLLILSPKCPNRMLPSGRAMNPTAKVAKAASLPSTPSCVGKKTSSNTNDAAVA